MAKAPGIPLTVILDQLPKLSAADLVEVEQAIKLRKDTAAKALAGMGPEPTKLGQHGVILPWGEVLLDCIIEVTSETVGYLIAKEQLRKMTAYNTSFRPKLPGLIKFIEHAAPEFQQRRAIFRLGIELLFGYLHRPDRMVGPQTLMQQIHRLPDALNAQFPGYAQAGLLGLVARPETLTTRDD
jgi:hypothetical protein